MFSLCFSWRDYTAPYCYSVLARVTGNPVPDEGHVSKRRSASSYVMNIARSKLIRHYDDSTKFVRREAMIAAIDCRVMLTFLPPTTPIHVYTKRNAIDGDIQRVLVDSHMRTVFSISASGETFHSGYPSEPILAEAAAHQWKVWRELWPESPDPILTTLEEGVRDRWGGVSVLEGGEVLGEAIARTLLLLGRDRAAVSAYHPDYDFGPGLDFVRPAPLSFSRPLQLTGFLEGLLGKEVACAVLDALPTNQIAAEGKPLRDAFSNAVVNFTHWVKWDNYMAANAYSGLLCFMRNAAAICLKECLAMDLFIPIYVPNEATAADRGLDVSRMTGIVIKVNLGDRPMPRNITELYEAENLQMFDGPSVGNHQLPFISLSLELSVHDKYMPPYLTGPGYYIPPPMQPDSDDHTEDLDHKTPDHLHPRYSASLYGCSSELYDAISSIDEESWRRLVQAQPSMLDTHPRQDEESLSIVRNQKPFFAAGQGSFSSWLGGDVEDHLKRIVDGM